MIPTQVCVYIIENYYSTIYYNTIVSISRQRTSIRVRHIAVANCDTYVATLKRVTSHYKYANFLYKRFSIKLTTIVVGYPLLSGNLPEM